MIACWLQQISNSYTRLHLLSINLYDFTMLQIESQTMSIYTYFLNEIYNFLLYEIMPFNVILELLTTTGIFVENLFLTKYTEDLTLSGYTYEQEKGG